LASQSKCCLAILTAPFLSGRFFLPDCEIQIERVFLRVVKICWVKLVDRSCWFVVFASQELIVNIRPGVAVSCRCTGCRSKSAFRDYPQGPPSRGLGPEVNLPTGQIRSLLLPVAKGFINSAHEAQLFPMMRFRISSTRFRAAAHRGPIHSGSLLAGPLPSMQSTAKAGLVTTFSSTEINPR